jgi:hypothetical protein
MTLPDIIKTVRKFTGDNSPMILTAVGVTGTIATAVLTHKAATKAERIKAAEIREVEAGRRFSMDRKETVRLTWKLYIPPVSTGVMTVAAIVGANHISTRRAAAMAAAYSISERAFSEYKEKVVEKLGESKHRSVRDELAQDRVNKDSSSREVIITGKGEVLFKDGFSGRYFKSDMQTVRSAVNDLNQQVIHNNYASLTDFYTILALEATSFSDEVGWNVDNLLEIEFSTAMTEDKEPCIVMDFQATPIRGYHRVH